MLCDLLVFTNLPFLAAAIIAFNKQFYIWCILLSVVFFASTAYHSNQHDAWLGIMDRICALCTCMVIGGLAILQSSRLSLSTGFICGIVGLCMFLHDHTNGYDDPIQCLTHSLWHIMAAVTCIIFISSF